MANKGWIKLHRKVADNPMWTFEKFTRGQAWIDLLLLANHKPGYIGVRGNRVEILRGQCGWSVKRLSERWTWSQGKVRRFLNELENDGQIEQQKNNISTVITIVNYNEYQGNGEQTDLQTENKQRTDRRADGEQTDAQTGTQTETNKNVKNNKNEKNKLIFPENLDTPEFEKAWADWEQHRREIKKPLTPTATQMQLKKLSTKTPEQAIAMIEQSIERGYQGMFEVSNSAIHVRSRESPASIDHQAVEKTNKMLEQLRNQGKAVL